ncbi:MAG: dienelactone hydrolase family protein [Beijerinckiaceae bacterium]|nr:dienelactone hydrolase family protein [Beijerinckiaceae bacterium]
MPHTTASALSGLPLAARARFARFVLASMPWLPKASAFGPGLRSRARRGAAIGLLLASCLATGTAVAQPEMVRIPAEEVELVAALYRPSGPGPHPAVIALHGCGGLFNRSGAPTARHADWGQRLADAGFLVVMPDSFRSRGLGSQCGISNRSVRPSRERVADVLATKIWLQARSDVKASAVSLLGWSNGGSTVLAAVRSDRRPGDASPDIARAVAFYPGCRGQAESSSFRTRLPLLIMIGEADDWTPAAPCKALAEAARARGEALDLKLYPGAYHDFDHPGRPVTERRDLAFTADGSGTARAGTNPAARQDALARVPAFLAR